jgi:repressor LexA
MVPQTKKMSDRQSKMLEFIRGFLKDHPYPPSVREIQLGCAISSTSVVDYNLHILRREGYIKRSPDISRGIELLEHNKARSIVAPGSISIPILGAIAAGEPLMAFPDSATDDGAETIDFPTSMLRQTESLFALKVKGQSMIEDLIDDGDIVLFQRRDTAQTGEMVAAWLKERQEATLKRFFPEGDKVRLQPANSSMSPIYVDASDVEVQGVVVGVIRMYN